MDIRHIIFIISGANEERNNVESTILALCLSVCKAIGSSTNQTQTILTLPIRPILNPLVRVRELDLVGLKRRDKSI